MLMKKKKETGVSAIEQNYLGSNTVSIRIDKKNVKVIFQKIQEHFLGKTALLKKISTSHSSWNLQ